MMGELVDSLPSTEPGWRPADDILRPIAATCSLARELLARMVDGEPVAVIERCRRTLQDLPVPLAVFEGPEHRLQIGNAAWYAMFGHAPVGGASYREIAGPRDELASELDRARGSGLERRVSSIAYRARRAGVALEGFYSAVMQPIDDRIVVAYADITREVLARRSTQAEHRELLASARAARAEAERSQRIKDWVVAVVSHELRAPLATIMLWEKALRDHPGVRDRALEAIRESGVAQSRLIDDLFDISHAMSGTLRIDSRPLAIELDLAGAVDRIRAAAAAKSLAIEHLVEPGLGEVVGDAHRLRQVLDTLLGNAVRFTEPGGRIAVTARSAGSAIEIAVNDSGCGFEPELASRLFTPFGRDGGPPADRCGGLGLGLMIAGRLVELHGGTLVASSDGAGRGATFTLTLPLAGVPARPVPSVADPPPPPNLDGLRVLVVEDSRDMREALEVVLGSVGAVVGCVESVDAAMTALGSSPWDVVVSDLEMPHEDGYSLARRIRGAAATRGLPAVALTASSAVADTDRAREAGFDVHVAKPVDLDVLVAGIAEAIATRRGPAA